jgi:cardiolipin synthase A/B
MVIRVMLAVAALAAGPQLISEPQAGNGPFLRMIEEARHSIELTMYELDDAQVEHALAAAATRGVDVRVLLNGGYYDEHETDNAPAFAYLDRHRVHVRYSPTYFALTHQKTLTVDGTESAIMTLNLDGGYSTTRDFAVIDRQPQDVRAIVQTFDDDWAGLRASPSTGSGDLVWSPGAAPTVLRLIDSARHTIDLENEEMADTPATDALCAAADRGVDVRIVMTYDREWSSALAALEHCGAHIHLDYGQRYYIHAKILLVDGTKALIGSQNLSTASLDDNRELGIVVTDRPLLTQLAAAFDRDDSG